MQHNIKTKAKAKASELDYHIGQTVKKIRIIKGYTQQDIAEKVSVTFQQIQKYENGKNRISASKLYEMMVEFEVRPSDFFDILDQRTNNVQKSAILFDRQSIEIVSLFRQIKNPELKDAVLKFVRGWTQKNQ